MEMDMMQDTGTSVTITANEDGTYTVGDGGDGQPARSLDEALMLAGQMLQAGAAPDRASIAGEVFAGGEREQPGTLARKPNMGGRY